MTHCSFRWTTEDQAKLFGQEWRPEGNPCGVIVLVHGLGEHSGRYHQFAEYFNRLGIGVLSFDLRGHGQSEGLRGHIASYDAIMNDIDRALEKAKQLYPSLPQMLYGHSLGGNIVLYYLMHKRPQLSGAVITSPGLAPAKDPGAKLIIGKLLYNLKPDLLMSNGLDQTCLSRDTKVVELYNCDPLVHGNVSARLGLDIINNGNWILQNAGKLPEIPVLLMQGTADRVINPNATEEFAFRAGNCITYKRWEGYYHELHNEPEKEYILQFVADWLKPLLAFEG